jgi:histidinol-phosphate aminotransferase
MKELVKPNINSLEPYRAGSSIEEVQAQYGVDRIIKLGSNENPLGTSPRALDAIKAALEKASVYPNGNCPELISALSDHYGLPEDRFLPGNGSDEIFLMIAGAFLRAGEKVLVSENTFSQYQCSSQIFEGTVEKVPLKNFAYDLEAFTEKADSARLIFLCNPNNPTGTYFTQQALVSLLEKAPESCLVVLDEAYSEFAEADDFPDFKELIKSFRSLLICRTFSKIYGLAALRLGYAIADPEVIEGLKKVKNFNPFNVNRLAQAGAIAALNDRQFFDQTRSMNSQGRDFLQEEFQKVGIEFLPSQANFVCFKGKITAMELSETMAKQGVIIRPLKSFGLDYWCRVTVGTREQNEVFLEALKKVL